MPTAKITTPKSKPLPPGVYTPVVTIYDDTPQQKPKLDAMYAHCQYLVNAGCHGLVYLGTNGEIALLDAAERSAIIQTAKRAVTDMGLPDYPLVAGISAQSTHECVSNARAAAEAGASWALLLPPSYWSKAVSPQVVVSFYRDVADASPLPIIVYNFPGVTSGVDIDSDSLNALADHPNIVAAKLTCGNVGKGIRVTAAHGPQHMAVFAGSADYLVPSLTLGASGCVVGMGNVFPRTVSRLYDLWASGKRDEAAELQELVARAEWACKKSLACTKYGFWLHVGKGLGIDEACCRMRKPYLPLGEDMKRWTAETLEVLVEKERSMPGREAIAK